MNLIADIESFLAALAAKQYFVALSAALKVLQDISSVLTPQQIAAAHDEAKGLSGTASELATSLRAKVDASKGATTIPWGSLLATLLAILAKLFPVILPAA